MLLSNYDNNERERERERGCCAESVQANYLAVRVGILKL